MIFLSKLIGFTFTIVECDFPLRFPTYNYLLFDASYGISDCIIDYYRIRPNYRTVRLGISKLLGQLICGKIFIYLPWIHYKKDQKRMYLMMIMRVFFVFIFFSDFLYKGICCGYSFELHRQDDAIQVSIHNICLYKEVKKKYTGCNLKTTEFLDCALIGVCAVI